MLNRTNLWWKRRSVDVTPMQGLIFFPESIPIGTISIEKKMMITSVDIQIHPVIPPKKVFLGILWGIQLPSQQVFGCLGLGTQHQHLRGVMALCTLGAFVTANLNGQKWLDLMGRK